MTKAGERLIATARKVRDDLDALVDRARSGPPMTEEEIAEQRESWVRGEMALGSGASAPSTERVMQMHCPGRATGGDADD